MVTTPFSSISGIRIWGLTLTSSNVFYAGEGGNVVSTITSAGVRTVLAGNGSVGCMDGTGSFVTFNQPYGVGLSPASGLFVADRYNNVVRKVITNGGKVLFG